MLRMTVTGLGIASGLAVVVAVQLSGASLRTSLDRIEAFIWSDAGLSLVRPGEPFPENTIAEIQDRFHVTRLYPVISRPAEIRDPDGRDPVTGDRDRRDAGTRDRWSRPIRLIALDLVGDPRLPILEEPLTAETLVPVLEPVVFVSERMHRTHDFTSDSRLRIGMADREGTFAVDTRPVPRGLVSRHPEEVVLIDIAQFQRFFGGVGEIDRMDIVGSPAQADSALFAVGGVSIPPRAAWITRGYESEQCRQWIDIRRGGANVIGSAAYVIGVILIYLSSLASYRRQSRKPGPFCPSKPKPLVKCIAKLAELLTCAMLALAPGTLLGFALGKYGFALAMAGSPDLPSVELTSFSPMLAALGLGVGLATAWHVLNRGDAEERAERVHTISKPPAAAAVVALIIALIPLLPFPIPFRPILAWVSAFLIVVAFALLGRPVLIGSAEALRRVISERAFLGRPVIASRLIEGSGLLGISLAFLLFSFAALTVSSMVDGHLTAKQTAWLSRAFSHQLLVTPLPADGAPLTTAGVARIDGCAGVDHAIQGLSLPSRPGALAIGLAPGTLAGAVARDITAKFDDREVAFTLPAAELPVLRGAFRDVARATSSLIGVLFVAAGFSLLCACGGFALDMPEEWRTLIALGAPWQRVASSAGLGFAVVSGAALVSGTASGWIMGLLVTGATVGPLIGSLLAMWPLVIAGAAGWVLINRSAFLLLRWRLGARLGRLWATEESR